MLMHIKLRFIKALIKKFRKFWGDVWSYLQYYRHDPSKPSKAAFLKLTHDEQKAWIESPSKIIKLKSTPLKLGNA